MRSDWARAVLTRREALLIVDQFGRVKHAGAELADWTGTGAVPEVGGIAWSGSPARVSTQRMLVLKRVLSSGHALSFVERIGDCWAAVTAHLMELGDGPLVAFTYRDVNRDIDADEELKKLRLRILTVQEQERRGISQQLHDELGQGMTVLLMHVRGVAELAKDGEDGEGSESTDLCGRAREAVDQVDALSKRIRQVFYRIRPPSFKDSSLVEAIEDYCASTSHSTGLTIDVDAEPGLPRLEGIQATALYRLLQEAVTNAVKHSSCMQLWVSLSHQGDGVCLSVEDDGTGFNMHETKYGMGLTGLTERFALLEGELTVDARPHGGTRLGGYLPVAGNTGELS